jgi:hypothetical protein
MQMKGTTKVTKPDNSITLMEALQNLNEAARAAIRAGSDTIEHPDLDRQSLREIAQATKKLVQEQGKEPESDIQVSFLLRLPDGMRDQIAVVAKANNRSMNAQIVHFLTKWIEKHEMTRQGDVEAYLKASNERPTTKPLPQSRKPTGPSFDP